MKRTIVTTLALTLCIAMTAQPVITRETLMSPGDTYGSASTLVVPDPGPSGESVTWDFSGVVISEPSTYDVVLPGLTPYGSTFPGANIAFTIPPQFYQYQNISAGAYEEHGYVIADAQGSTTLIYTDVRTLLQLPFSYQGQWNDDYAYTITYGLAPGVETLGEGSISVTADGYGALRLPQGTFADAIRVQVTGTSTDTTDLGAGLYERNYFTETSYLWFSPSYHAPLCAHTVSTLLRYTTVIQNGDTLVFEEQDQFKSFSLDPTAEPMPSATADIRPGQFDLSASPNPFEDNVTFTFLSPEPQQVELEIRDVRGIRITSWQWNAVSGENTFTHRLQHLVPGMYFAILRTSHGADIVPLQRPGG